MKCREIYLALLVCCLLFGATSFSLGKETTSIRKGEDLTVAEWLAKAERCLLNGNDSEAAFNYEQALGIDPENLSANIFLGNYYYVRAEINRKEIDSSFNKQKKHTQAEREEYFNALSELVPTYDKAKKYLEKVLSRFPSSEVKKTLAHIEQLYQTIQ